MKSDGTGIQLKNNILRAVRDQIRWNEYAWLHQFIGGTSFTVDHMTELPGNTLLITLHSIPHYEGNVRKIRVKVSEDFS